MGKHNDRELSLLETMDCLAPYDWYVAGTIHIVPTHINHPGKHSEFAIPGDVRVVVERAYVPNRTHWIMRPDFTVIN